MKNLDTPSTGRLQQTHAALDSVMQELEATLSGDARALAALRRVRALQAELASSGTLEPVRTLCA